MTIALKKIRIGNDFVFVWVIEKNQLPEDLSAISNVKLEAKVFNQTKKINFDPAKNIVDGNKLRLEFTPLICDTLGVYNLSLSYSIPDEGMPDGVRECTIDVDAFEIVPRSAQADESSEFSVTSDLAIAFKGDKGDPFVYGDFTPEQIEGLKVKGDKGDPFTYADFTPEQIEALKVKGDTGPMADVSMAVDENGDLIATINN